MIAPHPSHASSKSYVEELLELRHGVLWPFDGVANSPRVGVDLPVVSTLECLVTEEVDVLVLDAR